MKTFVKCGMVILALVLLANLLDDYVNPEVTDVTPYLTMSKEELETQLGITLAENPAMINKIYAYTNGEITVDGNSEGSIGIVYIDGRQAGIHIDDRTYGMFGIKMGDAEIGVSNDITFEYDEHFEVLSDIEQGSSTASFYANHRKGDCLVVVYNDTTNRVVALAYYSNGKKATEQLTSLF